MDFAIQEEAISDSLAGGWLFRMASKTWSKKLRLHETTQRELCRVGFVLFALLPVLCLVAYTLVTTTPWYQAYQLQRWQQRISDNLGVDCRFTSITFPSPDRFRAREFVCLHPETGKEILKVAQVDASMDRSGWTVSLSKPELNGQQVQNAMQVMHDWFLCRPQKSASLLRLSVPELAVFDGATTTTFQDIEVGLKPTESISTVYVKFSIEGQKFSEPGILIVERNHAQEIPTTQWRIESRDIAVPCNAIAARFPILNSLGKEAAFRGKMAWAQNDLHWVANINGTFSSVDMGMLTMPLGSPINGFGQLHIEHAELADAKLRSVRGNLDISTTGRETILGEWINRTVQAGVIAAFPESIANIKDKQGILQFAGMKFELDERGLLLQGMKASPNKWPETSLIVDGNLIHGTNGQRVDLATVANWLQSSHGPVTSGRSMQGDELGRFLIRTLPWASAEPSAIASKIATDRR